MGAFTDFIAQRIALWRFVRSPLGQALKIHARTYFASGILSDLSKKTKEKFIGDFLTKLSSIYASPEPVMALRTALVEYTLLWSDLAILALTEPEKEEMPYRDNPYISGQLHHHILEAAKHVDETAQFLWKNEGTTAAEMLDFANGRSAIMLFYMNGLNLFRLDFGDFDQEKDWFKPFGEACLVASEHRLRQDLKLPLLCDNILGALPYMTFFNLIVNGERNPFYAWTKTFPEWYLAGEGPLPLPA